MSDVTEFRVLQEYDSAVEWCAARGLNGAAGDPLPALLSRACCDIINGDPETFEECVRLAKYARAMDALHVPEE